MALNFNVSIKVPLVDILLTTYCVYTVIQYIYYMYKECWYIILVTHFPDQSYAWLRL